MSADEARQSAAERRREVLLELSDRIREIDDINTLSFEASSLLGQLLGVSRVSYGTIDHDAETLTVDRDWLAPGVESLAGTLNLRDYGSFIDDLKQDRLTVITNVDTDLRTAGGAAEALRARSAASFVNVPVVEKGRLAAVFFVNNAQPRDWATADLDLIKEFADRVRTATERLRVTEALRTSNAEFATMNSQLERLVEERTAAIRLNRDIIEANTGPIVAFDRDYRVTAFNKAHRREWRRLFGREATLGEVLPEQFPPDQATVLTADSDDAATLFRFDAATPFRDDAATLGGGLVGRF